MSKTTKEEYLKLLTDIKTLCLELGVCIAIGYFMGYYLDKYFHTGKPVTIIFILLGLVAGFNNLSRDSSKAQKDADEHKQGDINNEEKI